jgi:hypothetical protein
MDMWKHQQGPLLKEAERHCFVLACRSRGHRNFHITASLASQDVVDFSMSAYRRSLLLSGINVHCVLAAFAKFPASILFHMSEQLSSLHRAATETGSFRTS